MTIETTWDLDVDTVSPVAVGETVYVDVVTNVHWTCHAFEGHLTASVSGQHKVPMPTSPETYVDLSAIKVLDDDTRRATVIGWAEMIDPGFVDRTEASVVALIEAKKAKPVVERVTILRGKVTPPEADATSLSEGE